MTLLFSTHQEDHPQQQKIFICPELRQATTPKHLSPLQTAESAAHMPETKVEVVVSVKGVFYLRLPSEILRVLGVTEGHLTGYFFSNLIQDFYEGKKTLACPKNQILALFCQNMAVYLTIKAIFFFFSLSLDAIASSSHRPSYLGMCYLFIHQRFSRMASKLGASNIWRSRCERALF